MKRGAVITVAGTSSRFSRSLGREVCKPIFSEGPESDSLLFRQLNLLRPYDLAQITVVGGHKFEDLKRFLDRQAADLPVTLVRNEHYSDYGTCHSLAVGLAALEEGLEEVLFLEGDLLFDAPSLKRIMNSPRNVVTATRDLIRADLSVAFYLSAEDKLGYIYDSEHKKLELSESFKIMGNSGQVWKFTNAALLREIMTALSTEDRQGTNLIIISRYFNRLLNGDIDFIEFQNWINCNTIEDYRAAMAAVEAHD